MPKMCAIPELVSASLNPIPTADHFRRSHPHVSKLDWKWPILLSAQQTGIKLYLGLILNSLRICDWKYDYIVKHKAKQLTLLDSETVKRMTKFTAVSSTSIFLCALKTLEAFEVIQTLRHLWREIASNSKFWKDILTVDN